MNSKDFIINGTTLVKYIGYDTIVEIPNCVTEIGREAFYRCQYLEEVYFPFSVDVIGSHAFEDCENLRKVKLPTLLRSIESYGFYRCVKLESITFPDGLMNIGDYSFYECKRIEEVTLPESVKSVGYYAFSECCRLKRLTVHENLGNTGRGIFYRSSLNQIDVIENDRDFRWKYNILDDELTVYNGDKVHIQKKGITDKVDDYIRWFYDSYTEDTTLSLKEFIQILVN